MEWTIAFFDQLEKLLLATHADIGMIAFDHDKNYCDICDKCFFFFWRLHFVKWMKLFVYKLCQCLCLLDIILFHIGDETLVYC